MNNNWAYPLLGPLGTIMGKTPPTPPQKTVNTIKGITDTPIFSVLLIIIIFFNTDKKNKIQSQEHTKELSPINHMTNRFTNVN